MKNTERAIEFTRNLTFTWDSSDFKEKLKIQKMIYSGGFYYDNKKGKPRTTKMNPVLLLIASLKGNTEESETGTSEVIFKIPGW